MPATRSGEGIQAPSNPAEACDGSGGARWKAPDRIQPRRARGSRATRISKGADPADEGMLVNHVLPPSPLFVHGFHSGNTTFISMVLAQVLFILGGGQLIWADLEDWYSNLLLRRLIISNGFWKL